MDDRRVRNYRRAVRNSALVLALTLISAGQTQAAALQQYNTSGLVARVGSEITGGSDAASFMAVSNGSLDESKPFKLGDLAIQGVGHLVEFEATPVFIDLDIPGLHQTVFSSQDPNAPYAPSLITEYVAGFSVNGSLSGTVNPDGSSQLRLAFDSPTLVWPGPTATDGHKVQNVLPFPISSVHLPAVLEISTAAGEAPSRSMRQSCPSRQAGWSTRVSPPHSSSTASGRTDEIRNTGSPEVAGFGDSQQPISSEQQLGLARRAWRATIGFDRQRSKCAPGTGAPTVP